VTRTSLGWLELPCSGQQYADISENVNGYCPNHSTGVMLPVDFVVTPLQYMG
jgi:hypothetical protein